LIRQSEGVERGVTFRPRHQPGPILALAEARRRCQMPNSRLLSQPLAAGALRPWIVEIDCRERLSRPLSFLPDRPNVGAENEAPSRAADDARQRSGRRGDAGIAGARSSPTLAKWSSATAPR
jgi:hypothetical protein